MWGEIPVAFVVLQTRVRSLHGDRSCTSLPPKRLAKFKMPRRYVFQTEPLPKGGTGKILKRELREQFWKGKDRRVQG